MKPPEDTATTAVRMLYEGPADAARMPFDERPEGAGEVPVDVPGAYPPEFWLWQIIDGMLRIHDLEPDERLCRWCDAPAVVMVPRRPWDPLAPLTVAACLRHGGLDGLLDGHASQQAWDQYLSFLEGSAAE